MVGVFPPGFDFFGQGKGDVYRLLPAGPNNNHWLVGVGRLKPGITVDQAQAAMNVVARHLEETSSPADRGWGVIVEPLQESLFGSLRELLFPLSATVAL